MKIPTPREGWRVFAGEVGVIVLGVLIALGAQQVVDNWKMREDARALAETLDHEIALNLAAYDVRARQHACVEERLQKLEAWLERTTQSGVATRIQPIPPAGWSLYRSAWDSRDPEAFRELPLERRLKYAEFYDELASNERQITEESERWMSLFNLYAAGPVSKVEIRDATRTFAALSSLSSSITNNIALSQRIARDLGVEKGRIDGMSKEFERWVDECVPLEPMPKPSKT